MRIVHVLAPSSFGGLERVVQLLLDAQVRSGHQVTAVTMLDAGSAEPLLLEQLRESGVDVKPVVHKGRAYGDKMRSLASVCRSIRPDVIHSHGYVADVLLAWRGLARVHPIVSSVHGFTGGGRKNQLYEWLQVRALKRFHGVVAVSAKLGTQLSALGIRTDRLHVIPNAFPARVEPITPVDARTHLGVPHGKVSLGWIGRISHEKGLDLLIEALPLIQAFDWHLSVIGEGRERGLLEKRAAALGLSERIGWLGAIPNSVRFMRGLDALIISSRTEGTPMVLLEAIANSVSVITTAVGGIPDIVSGAQAILVPSGEPSRLADGIRDFFLDRGAAEKRASLALERLLAENTMQTFVSRYDAVYRTVSGSRPS